MARPPENPNPAAEVLFSIQALRRAWQQVRRNGASPGSDRVTLEAFESDLDAQLNRLRGQILDHTYQPQAVIRFYIKKASGKQRPIALWAMRDKVAQRVVHDYLTSVLEPMFLNCSYGFRIGRGIEGAVQAVERGRDAGLRWVLDADISDCFGSIPLDILLGQVRRVVPSDRVVNLIEQWLWAKIQGDSHTVAGLSQGGVISPQLANLYLHRFDEMVLAALPEARLIRFADDFIVLNRDEKAASWSLDVCQRSLANLRLALNMRKTRLVQFDEGFNFLGVHFMGQQVLWPRANEE